MDIRYTREAPAAILNPGSGEICALDGKTPAPRRLLFGEPKLPGPTAQMFAFLSGELLEQNEEGGHGTIPDDAGFVQCGVLNISDVYPPVPHLGTVTSGVRCIVTANKGVIDHESTLIVVREDETGIDILFGDNIETTAQRLLYDPVRKGEGRELDLRSYVREDRSDPANTTLVPIKLTVRVHNEPRWGLRALKTHRILELLFWHELHQTGVAKHQLPWEQGLSVSWGVDGKLYRNVGGILRWQLRGPYVWSKLFPKAKFVTDPRPGFNDGDLYLIQRYKKWFLYGRYPVQKISPKPKNGSGRNRRFFMQVSTEMASDLISSRRVPEVYYDRILPPPAPTNKSTN